MAKARETVAREAMPQAPPVADLLPKSIAQSAEEPQVEQSDTSKIKLPSHQENGC